MSRINYSTLTTPAGNIISDPSLLSIENNGARPFLWGISPLGEGEVWWRPEIKYSGFMGIEPNNGLPNNDFNNPQIFTFSAYNNNIRGLTINFDNVAKQWATELVINGTTYNNDSSNFIWNNKIPVSFVTLEIKKWNKPFYPVRITSILDNETAINYIAIGKTRDTLSLPKWLADFRPRNDFERGNPPETNDGTIHYTNVDRGYRPSGTFSFNFRSQNEFSEAVQIFNGDPFLIAYIDPEIQEYVIRKVETLQWSLNRFINAYRQYLGVSNIDLQVQSMYRYDSYNDLKERATVDNRF
jgi:hypothetical protein